MSRTFRTLFEIRPEKNILIYDEVEVVKQRQSRVKGGHMKYYYDNYDDIIRYNLPIDGRKWHGGRNAFEDPRLYRPIDISNYVRKWYIDYFNDKNLNSPFMNDSDFINTTVDDIFRTRKLLPHQKFVGEHFSPSTDFGGGLLYHKLGSGKTLSSIIIAEHNKNAYIDMTIKESPGEYDTRVKKINNDTCHIIVLIPAQTVNQYKNEIIGNIRKGKLHSQVSECVLFIDDETDSSNYKKMRQYYTGYINSDSQHVSENIRNLEQMEKLLGNERIKLSGVILNSRLSEEEKSIEKIDIINNIVNLETKIDNLKNEMNKNIKYVYTIISHITFLRRLQNTKAAGTHFVPSDYLYSLHKDKEMPNQACFKSDRTLLIVDEIHKLISKEGIYYSTLYNFLFHYARQANGDPAIKLILMSATPIYDTPEEIGLLINLLRPRILFPYKDDMFNRFFINSQGNLKNKLCYQYLTSGYVSFSEGSHPASFPFRRNIIKTHKISNLQMRAYVTAIESDLKKIKSNNKVSDDISNTAYTKSRQFLNVVFSNEYDNKVESNENSGYDLMNGMLESIRNFIKSQKVFDAEKVLEKIEYYSPKFAYIIKKLITSKNEGTIIVYSKWVSYGIAPIFEILNMFPGYNMLNYSESSMDASDILDDNRNTGTTKFAVWSPEAIKYISESKKHENIKEPSLYTNNVQQLFNSIQNKDGGVCKIIFCTVTESISFKYVSQIHIVNPWWNMSDTEQAIGRGIRFGSHVDLPKDRQNVDVYLHCSVLGGALSTDRNLNVTRMKKYNELSLEQLMYMTAIRKNNINNQFENAIKETAIDMDLNKYGNYSRFEEYVYDTNIEIYEGTKKVTDYKLFYDRSVNKNYIYLNDSQELHTLTYNYTDIEKYNVYIELLDDLDQISKILNNIFKESNYLSVYQEKSIEDLVSQYPDEIRSKLINQYKNIVSDLYEPVIFSDGKNEYVIDGNMVYLINIKGGKSSVKVWPYKNAVVGELTHRSDWDQVKIEKVYFTNGVNSVSIIVKNKMNNFNKNPETASFNFYELKKYAINKGEDEEVWEYFEKMAFKVKTYKLINKVYNIPNVKNTSNDFIFDKNVSNAHLQKAIRKVKIV